MMNSSFTSPLNAFFVTRSNRFIASSTTSSSHSSFNDSLSVRNFWKIRFRNVLPHNLPDPGLASSTFKIGFKAVTL